MKTLSTKLAILGLMGAMFAIPAASQADALKVNLFGLHIAIGHDHCAPPAIVVVDRYDWRWRRDHGYDDWVWYRDHPGFRGERADFRGRDFDRDRGHDRDRDRDRDRDHRDRR